MIVSIDAHVHEHCGFPGLGELPFLSHILPMKMDFVTEVIAQLYAPSDEAPQKANF